MAKKISPKECVSVAVKSSDIRENADYPHPEQKFIGIALIMGASIRYASSDSLRRIFCAHSCHAA